MGSFINSSNDASITKLPDKFYYDELFADVSLGSTYLELIILLVTIPATIIPAAIIIHIIRKTEEPYPRMSGHVGISSNVQAHMENHPYVAFQAISN